jgi:hypothetical protein
MKHIEINHRKQVAIQGMEGIIHNTGIVNLHNLYTEDMKSIWGTRAYFVQDFIKFSSPDIEVTAKKKAGTIAYNRKYHFNVGKTTEAKAVVPKKVDKTLTMGGLFPRQYIGKIAQVDVSNFKLIAPNKHPKMFLPLKMETKALYRTVIDDMVTYCQITNDDKQYIFRPVS